ncbi:hypothetical protein TNCV_982771 [Trichonephila clavipes]|nr:hypothetical protein TNCV_982771 [Trichonephila clavipes]
MDDLRVVYVKVKGERNGECCHGHRCPDARGKTGCCREGQSIDNRGKLHRMILSAKPETFKKKELLVQQIQISLQPRSGHRSTS